VRNLTKAYVLYAVLSLFFAAGYARAGGFGMGAHAGYGTFKYEEQSSALGPERRSAARLDAVLFGVSGEYSFTQPRNFYAGLTTDFALGPTGTENHFENGVKFQTNDLEIFGQFYDLRLGYRNSLDKFYYTFYISGGWDGIHFERDAFVENGVSSDGKVTEDFSLWRTGGGLGLGYKLGEWALDGRFAYAYYPEGTVRNSNFRGIKFDTDGTCLDMGAGIARRLTENMNFYFGVSYTLIELDESEVERNVVQDGVARDVVFPNSKTQMTVGIVNLTYAF